MGCAELEEDGVGSRECWWREESYRSLFFALLSPFLTTTHTRHPRKQRGRRVPKTRKKEHREMGEAPVIDSEIKGQGTFKMAEE